MSIIRVLFIIYTSLLLILGGVGHCFAWHVQVNPVFGFNFKSEELIHNEWAVCNVYHQPLIFVWKT